jgi:hypothetical protein
MDKNSDFDRIEHLGIIIACVVHVCLFNQKYQVGFEMWCWRRKKKTNWFDRVRNEEVLHRVKEDRNILHTTKRRKSNWIGHILRRTAL